MNHSSRLADRPLWVRIILLGVCSRNEALFWLWTANVLAIAVVTGGTKLGVLLFGTGPFELFLGLFLSMVLGAGAGLIATAYAYWRAIRWSDQHEGWDIAPTPHRTAGMA